MELPAASACEAAKTARWTRLRQVILGTHTIALADQAIVSGTSFLTTVFVGRWTVPSELGVYSVGISLLASLLAVQDALILLPYTIQRHRPTGTPAEHAGSALVLNGWFTVLGVVLLAATAWGLSFGNTEPALVSMVWVLAAVAPVALLREFGRGVAFAHLEVTKALFLDAAMAAVLLGALIFLDWTGQMSAAAACGALGAACALTGGAWLYAARGGFSIRSDRTWETAKQSWGLGKWLCAGQITMSVQGYGTYWLLPFLLGYANTGVYAACMNIASLANPLLAAFRNILTPRSVLSLREGGVPQLRRQVIRDTLLLEAAMAVFCIAIWFVGDKLVQLLFLGADYDDQGLVISVLALSLLASAAGSPASNALASMERPRAIIWTTAIGAIVTVALVWLSILEWGLLGAAFGALAGNVAGSVARWVAFLAIASRYESESHPSSLQEDTARSSVFQVLKQMTGNPAQSGWAITPLDEGNHATVYAVRSKDHTPVWHSYDDLVIKLYRSALKFSNLQGKSNLLNVEVARAQFEALARIRRTLHGQTVDGWRISVPEPIYICTSPLAMVMSRVPGKDLQSFLITGKGSTREFLETAASGIAGAMAKCWTLGQAHGDLCPANVVCDLPNRELSFIDAGTLQTCSICTGRSMRWSPAVSDLGHALSDRTSVKSSIGNYAIASRKRIFIEAIIRAYVAKVESPEQRRKLLEDIESCADFHVKSYNQSYSPRGLLHALRKKIALRRVQSTMERVKADLAVDDGPGGRLP